MYILAVQIDCVHCYFIQNYDYLVTENGWILTNLESSFILSPIGISQYYEYRTSFILSPIGTHNHPIISQLPILSTKRSPQYAYHSGPEGQFVLFLSITLYKIPSFLTKTKTAVPAWVKSVLHLNQQNKNHPKPENQINYTTTQYSNHCPNSTIATSTNNTSIHTTPMTTHFSTHSTSMNIPNSSAYQTIKNTCIQLLSTVNSVWMKSLAKR